jgi:exodeoxyribonuclease-5
LRRWEDRWQIKAALNDIRHIYAMTTHTSQGSTFEVVFLDVRDMMQRGMMSPAERSKLLYTATTRPRTALGLYWSPQTGFI